MGYLSGIIVKRKDLPIKEVENTENSSEDSLKINKDYCIGCGFCSKKLPQYIELKNNKAIVIIDDIAEKDTALVLEIVRRCPTQAIYYANNLR